MLLKIFEIIFQINFILQIIRKFHQWRWKGNDLTLLKIWKKFHYFQSLIKRNVFLLLLFFICITSDSDNKFDIQECIEAYRILVVLVNYHSNTCITKVETLQRCTTWCLKFFDIICWKPSSLFIQGSFPPASFIHLRNGNNISLLET